jgi:hypothetical protein
VHGDVQQGLSYWNRLVTDSTPSQPSPPLAMRIAPDVTRYRGRFRGVHSLPKGLHLVTTGTGQGLRQGFFLNITRPGQVVRPA